MNCCRWARAGVVGGLAAAWAPESAWGCAACFGRSDSPLAAGMNMGILALLVVIFCVLAGIASFFVFLARRAAHTEPWDGAPGVALPEISAEPPAGLPVRAVRPAAGQPRRPVGLTPAPSPHPCRGQGGTVNPAARL